MADTPNETDNPVGPVKAEKGKGPGRVFRPKNAVQLGQWYVGIMVVGALAAFLNDVFHLSSQNIDPLFGAVLGLFLMAFLHYFDMLLNGQL